jgi:DNA polymerase delta subunit 3
MLYEFHRKQNAKKPGSVHAIYLICGTQREDELKKKEVQSRDEQGDTAMRSSPPAPGKSVAPPPEEDTPAAEPIPVRSILLVRQEHLEQAKATFEAISSIHIYSLEANSLNDVEVLTDCNRKIAVSCASEDPLQTWKQYGTIHNPNAKKRPRRTALPPSAEAPVTKTIETKVKPGPTTKTDSQKPDSKASSAKASPEPEKKAAAKPPAAKRQSSDIFKSFAKAKTKPKEESQSSAEATPAPEEDQAMGGFSEDEGDDDAFDEAMMQAEKAPAGKSKAERKAELQAMMDQEDEEMEDAAPEEEEPEVTIDRPAPAEEEEPKESVTTENGRRRGRRRVMKKKTVKDEEGYLGMSYAHFPPTSNC